MGDTMHYNTVSTVQYSTIQYNTIQYNIEWEINKAIKQHT